MLLPIYIYGHPVLRKVSEDITPEYAGLSKLLDDMWQTMYESDGVGLAAPQIGKNIRILLSAAPRSRNWIRIARILKKLLSTHIS